MENSPFNTARRIRLGLWGLGRGLYLSKVCADLNMDLVAGCDFNAHMRAEFAQGHPGAFVTADADEFLARDFDAVLLATFCPAHAGDAIRCLRAGKHVLSEVTAFFTPAEGVRLVEEVERSGRVYQLAENYPYSAANMFLAAKYKEGLFGELMYAEYEYVHECRSLSYTYIDGLPVQPGSTVHNWRSWFNFHYYCTHSLGPVMYISGTRPVRVVSLPSGPHLPGFVGGLESQCLAPSLIRMNNGALVRNLMGATTNDTHVQRLWGTKGAAELNVGKELQLRLGGSGHSPKFEVQPEWPMLREYAERTGHGGGDFWVLYFFARQILTGEPGPFAVYSACDVTLPGILARRSALEGGRPYDVPDFRKPEERAKYREDHGGQTPFDTLHGVFPPEADPGLTGQFSSAMKELLRRALQYRACADWTKVAASLKDRAPLEELVRQFITDYPQVCEAYRAARRIMDASPDSPGGRALREILEDVGDEKAVLAPGFLAVLRADPRLKPPVRQLQMLWPARLLRQPPAAQIPAEFELRLFRPEDEEAYLKLMVQVGFSCWNREFFKQVAPSILPDGHFVVMHRASGALAATAMAHHRPLPEHPCGGELGWVAGDGRHNGKGLGRAVCAAATARLIQAGYTRIYLRTDDERLPALKTYLKLGYTPFLLTPDAEARWKAVCGKLGLPFVPAEETPARP